MSFDGVDAEVGVGIWRERPDHMLLDQAKCGQVGREEVWKAHSRARGVRLAGWRRRGRFRTVREAETVQCLPA